MNVVINAEDKVLGRMAAYAAKQAMNGNKVDIVNCEKAVVTGSRQSVFSDYKRKRSMGVPKKGPFFPRHPERIVRRTIRGMLPYKGSRGKEAFGNVKCHVGLPKEFDGKKQLEMPNTDISKLKNLKFVYIHEISKELGA
ncbi:50S ribosomal protein L13 [Nanoarchaeota archaeon]